MTITIDPTNLSAETKLLLKRLLYTSQEIYFEPGRYKVKRSFMKTDTVEIFLTHHLVKGFCKHNPEYKRVEVLGKKLGSGSYGSLYDSLGVLHTEKNMHFKVRTPDKEKVVKQVNLKHSAHLDVIAEEKQINLCSNKIRCKPSLFNSNYGFLRMTKAHGIPLDDLISSIQKGKTKLSLLKLLKLSINLITALHNLHKQGWIHRDIKPDNIIVDLENLEVTLIDFGFTCKKGSVEVLQGNWYYIAPEYVDSYVVTRKIDWFSMGKTLAELWGDRSIDSFNSDECTIDEAYSYHSCEEFIDLFHCVDMPKEFQNDLKVSLQNMTRVDPTKRIGYKEMRQALQTLIDKVESSEINHKLVHENCIKLCDSDHTPAYSAEANSEEDTEDNSEDYSEKCLFKFKTR
ncbi:protein kinase domain-containing protein [Legionella waltersii]|uniref:Serine/threonine-protein kinase n=1 Tax=Legionella waltersii TaxID=66969 RepID=A0A0W1AAR5_9GAMM|nr:protein kinase [Legionella waltersii]KTD78375.1 serine/threonine-protein kinase [Legionella waltersii]SNV06382.1 serine/threonine-protein kinase [Legionella waltersii]